MRVLVPVKRVIASAMRSEVVRVDSSCFLRRTRAWIFRSRTPASGSCGAVVGDTEAGGWLLIEDESMRVARWLRELPPDRDAPSFR